MRASLSVRLKSVIEMSNAISISDNLSFYNFITRCDAVRVITNNYSTKSPQTSVTHTFRICNKDCKNCIFNYPPSTTINVFSVIGIIKLLDE